MMLDVKTLKFLLHHITQTVGNSLQFWTIGGREHQNAMQSVANVQQFQKVFGTVNHSIMMTKIRAIDVRGTAADWFASYLNNRRQYCSYGNQKSSESLITCGIPQGSCLGPFLFIIYINDFESLILRNG